jgi:hypothetical protein
MIVNKKLQNDPPYYKKWDDFKGNFSQEASFICGEFNRLCKTKRQIIGRDDLIYILETSIPKIFPSIKTEFKRIFPNYKLDEVLGIGLWKIVDADENNWRWENYPNTDCFQTKIYTRV